MEGIESETFKWRVLSQVPVGRRTLTKQPLRNILVSTRYQKNQLFLPKARYSIAKANNQNDSNSICNVE